MSDETHETQPSLFVEDKPAVLRLADFGDLAQYDTRESHVKELIWQLEMYHSRNGGAVTVSRKVLRARFYWNAGVSRNVFDAARKAAEALKVIRVDREPRKMGGQGANTYVIDWKRIQKLGTIQAAPQATSATQPPTTIQAASANQPTERTSDRVPENKYPGPSERVGGVPSQGGAVPFPGPLNKEYNHPSVTVSTTHGHGNGFSREKRGDRWPNPITVEDLRKPATVLRLYRIAVSNGYVVDSEINMIQFFSQARYCRLAEDVQSPGAVFTTRIKEGMTKSVRHEDEDAARRAVKQLLYGASANE